VSGTDVVLTAIHALRTNVLRTLLTMLGIIIGISAVITLTAAGQGAQQGVTKRIRGLGSNLLFIRPGTVTTNGAAGIPGAGPSLYYEDAVAIGDQHYAYVDSIAAQGTAGGPGAIFPAQVIFRGQNASTTLVGTEPSYEHVRDFYHAAGRFISDDDVTKKALVVDLGSGVAQKLFGSQDPIGAVVRIAVGPGNFAIGFNFTVIGVMEMKGASSTSNQDDQVLIPLTSFIARVPFLRNPRGYTVINQINIKLADTSKTSQAEQDIGELLRARHAVSTDDFTIQSQSDVLSTATDVQKTLQVLLVSIALISLIVGGIGIMNIMLVSVSERTREIGIRKAIGAKRRDILLQFIIEALTVTTIGGALGVAAGVGLTQILQHSFDFHINLIARNIHVAFKGSTYVITPLWVTAGLGMSAATGLVFGVYPAWRAARLDPIEALRRE
jgi:putative ABC transport system permease protein